MHDKLPNSVCEECETNIHKLYNFRKVIQNSDQELKKHLQALENTKVTSQSSSKSQTKTEVGDLKTDKQDNIDDYKNVASDKMKMSKEPFAENESNDLVCDLPEIDDRSSESETSIEPPTKNKAILRQKTNAKRIAAQKFNHLSQKQYSCEKCNYTCVGHSAWRKHQLSCHYQCVSCNICNKLVRQGNLSRHVRNHSHEFKCKECGESFNSRDSLKAHKNENHKRVELPCEKCGKVFHYQGALNRHLKLKCKYFGDCDACLINGVA